MNGKIEHQLVARLLHEKPICVGGRTIRFVRVFGSISFVNGIDRECFFSAFCELTSVEWWSAFNYVSWISSLLVTFRFEWSHSKHTFFTTTEILIKGKVPRNQNYFTNLHELTFSIFASVTTSLPIMENLLIFNDSQGRRFADGAKVSLLLAVSSSKVPLPD